MKTNAKKRSKSATKKSAKRDFTPKQKLFVQEYLKDMNATQAYIRAGYRVSQKVAEAAGPRMLGNVKVFDAVHRVLENRLKQLEINNSNVLQEIARAAFANVLDYVKINTVDGTASIDLSNLTREQAAAIQEITYDEGVIAGKNGLKPARVKFRLVNKLAALELLGKYLKLFNDTTPLKSTKTAKILQDVLNEKLTVREAAYRFNMLGLPIPEALKIELQKQEPTSPVPDLPPDMDDAELERRYQEAMSDIDKQKEEWVPERKAEVEAIKDELKDAESFGPDAEANKKGGN